MACPPPLQESDGEVLMRMLRRASIDIDVDRINMAGMTALHQVGHTAIKGRCYEIELFQNLNCTTGYNLGFKKIVCSCPLQF
jgi:hypothetical protein